MSHENISINVAYKYRDLVKYNFGTVYVNSTFFYTKINILSVYIA